MDYMDIVMKAYEVADELKKTKEYKELQELKSKIGDTKKDIVTKFNNAKEKFYEAKKYGIHHPDLKKYKEELIHYKEELFNDEIVSRYKELENSFQQNLYGIVNKIKESISTKASLVNEIGLLEKREPDECQKKVDDDIL